MGSGISSEAMLFKAAIAGDVPGVLLMLDKGLSVDTVDPNSAQHRRSLLHAAAVSGKKEVVALVLARHAAGDGKKSKGRLNKAPVELELLLKVSQLGFREVLGLLLDHWSWVNPNYPVDHHNGNTCLHLACEHGHDEVVSLLLERGTVASKPNTVGITPLHIAAGCGHARTVKALAAAGGELHSRDFQGWPPLHHSAFFGKLDTCDVLLSFGADPTKRGYRGRLARDLANTRGHAQVATWLEAAEEKAVEKAARMALVNTLVLTPVESLTMTTTTTMTPVESPATTPNMSLAPVVLSFAATTQQPQQPQQQAAMPAAPPPPAMTYITTSSAAPGRLAPIVHNISEVDLERGESVSSLNSQEDTSLGDLKVRSIS